MTSNKDQETLIDNLKRLKNIENEFGKIRVTDDYTSGERERKRVRGDPRNGLGLVSFTRLKPNSA